MPIPALDKLTPEFRELVEIVERGLFTIAKTDMSRDEAIEIKQRITRPLGVLNSRFRLSVSIRRSNNAHPHSNNALTTER